MSPVSEMLAVIRREPKDYIGDEQRAC